MDHTSNCDKANKSSHKHLLENRAWLKIPRLWKNLLNGRADDNSELYTFCFTPGEYSITNLNAIHQLGAQEFVSSDPRYVRQTFAMRIGYDGSHYQGYQRQKGVEKVSTVEEDLFYALGERTCVAAGRTDRDVSAISQIISFSTYEDITAEQFMTQINTSTPAIEGKLYAYDCIRVPKRFHALFSATWRRYIFLFPLNKGLYDGVDIDISLVNRMLNNLQHMELPFDAYAYREDRSSDKSDVCTLFRALAVKIPINPINPANSDKESSSVNNSVQGSNNDISLQYEDNMTSIMAIELVGTRFLRRMVRILVATVVRASWQYHEKQLAMRMMSPNDMRMMSPSDTNDLTQYETEVKVITETNIKSMNNESQKYDNIDVSMPTICTDKNEESTDKTIFCNQVINDTSAEAATNSLITTTTNNNNETASPKLQPVKPSDMIELTNQNYLDELDENILVKIAYSSKRYLTSIPVTGLGLGLAGVGYDMKDLAINKFSQKMNNANLSKQQKKDKAKSLDFHSDSCIDNGEVRMDLCDDSVVPINDVHVHDPTSSSVNQSNGAINITSFQTVTSVSVDHTIEDTTGQTHLIPMKQPVKVIRLNPIQPHLSQKKIKTKDDSTSES